MFKLLSSKRSFVTFIETSSTGIVQTFGRVGGIWRKDPILPAGVHFYIPLLQSIKHVSNKRNQTIFDVACRTIDGVSVDLKISIQYTIKESDSMKALFSLTNPIKQIESIANDSLRSSIASKKIDDLYMQQNDISDIVMLRLKEMETHGYTCNMVLISDIEPDKKVKATMNNVNASIREKLVAQQNAEADYIKITRNAEARAQEMASLGRGISEQRHAILQGYSENMTSMSDKLGVSSDKLMSFLTKMQEIDMNRELAHSNNSKIIFIPKSDVEFDKSLMYANECK